MSQHFIYIGTSLSQNKGKDNKIGRSEYLNDRLQNLDTSYSIDGFSIKFLIICESLIESQEIEEYLHSYFWDYSTTKLSNITSNGTEWFNRDFTDENIKEALLEGNYYNKIITDKDEIDKITKKSKREEIKNNYIKKMNQKSFERKNKLAKLLSKARDYQKEVELLNYYNNNDKGILNWCCGLGKSFETLLYIEYYNFDKILIGVPSIILQKHWNHEIKEHFNNYEIIFVGGNEGKNEKEINDYFNKHKKLIIISTYASCKKILDYNVEFNFKVGDEAHHLNGDNIEYNKFHNIKANKELYLTATIKELTNNSNGYSMDNTEQFGNIIEKKTINWAIDNQYITDYDLILIKYEIDIDVILKEINCNNIENRELLISAYLILKSIILYNDLTNIFVYTNTPNNADLVTKYIDILINTSTLFPELNEIKNQIHNKAYHSKSNIFDLKSKEVLKNKIIITSIVYSLGEGFNYPELNGVCFAENMMSNIRIIQSLLRPHRLDKNNLNKIAKVLISFNINDLNYKENNIYTISKQLRNEDENIKQRIKLIEIITKKSNPYQKLHKTSYDIKIDNPEELKKILIKLESSLNKYFKDLAEEYKYVQNINKEFKLDSEKEYISNQEKHNNYIDNPKEYFSTCWNNWYDFLGYDTEIFIQSKDDWKKFGIEKGVNNYNHYLELCKDFKELPKMPEEFYKDYTNFNNEFNLNCKRR